MLYGGTEKQLATLIRGLDRSRFAPALCTLRPSVMDVSMLDCPVIELNMHSFRSPRTLAHIVRLRRFMSEKRIQLVQTFFQDPTIVGLLAAVGTECRARVCSFRDLGFWRTPLKVLQLRLAYPHFDGFIANSRAVALRAHELDRIPLDRIEVLYNGVAMPAQRACWRGEGAPVIGIVANLNRSVKRVDLFVRAAALVRGRIPAARFVVVGDGSLRTGLAWLADELLLGESITFLGSLQDVGPHVASFDVGVISSDSEGFSNAVLEYMAAGVPAVVRNVGGNSEVVEDYITGRLVDSDRPQDLADAIVSVLLSPDMWGTMSVRSREVARERYSLEACVQGHQRYYSRLLGLVS
jgi:glycosyltransferase involved in cell wall biosynthesis